MGFAHRSTTAEGEVALGCFGRSPKEIEKLVKPHETPALLVQRDIKTHGTGPG